MLGLEDLPRALELSTEANWNQTANDWRFFLNHAHAYGLDWGDRGLVGTTVAWDLPPASCWIAMVIVAKSCRGQGFARTLMQRAIEDGEARGLAPALDATHLGEPVYAQMGFAGDECIARMFCPEPDFGSDVSRCRRLEATNHAEFAELDARCSGFKRSSMLRDRLRRMPEAAWGTRDAAGRLRGMVLGREGRVAGQIGPLFASDTAMAQSLVAAALSEWAGPVYLDVPVRQIAFQRFLESQGFAVEREFKRMTRPAREGGVDWSQTFAIAGPDFG